MKNQDLRSTISSLAVTQPEKSRSTTPPGYESPEISPPAPCSTVPQQQSNHLVSQFANLASRLGVKLPANVINSLTASAAANEANANAIASAVVDPTLTSDVPSSPAVPDSVPESSFAASLPMIRNVTHTSKSVAPLAPVASTAVPSMVASAPAKHALSTISVSSGPTAVDEIVGRPQRNARMQTSSHVTKSPTSLHVVPPAPHVNHSDYFSRPNIPTSTSTIATISSSTLLPPSITTSLPLPPAVNQLQKTAEAAIAAVSGNRKRNSEEILSGSMTTPAGNKPSYSKRRKKPRLSDCETRLAQLKAENETLKRHLNAITNQSHKLDKDREAVENKMIKMSEEENVEVAELDSLLHNYTEMYSDYGKNRYLEVTFHLEQLQKLTNPTNFTKMGLWSLGHHSTNPKTNPIAGILQKELGITPQQGRKILDQRQKIRDLCANLKKCHRLIGQLKELCEQKTKVFHDRMTKCREILTPRQAVKLLVWTTEHSHLLERVCPGWGSEHIHATPKK